MADTTDNAKVSFRLVTFIAIIIVVASSSFTVSGFIFNSKAQSEKIDKNHKYCKEENLKLYNRITKTTERNAKAIKELKEQKK